MAILVVGGDSVDAIKQRACTRGHRYVEHWSGRKTRDLAKSIPKDTEAVVVVLNLVSHALARRSGPKRPAAAFPSSFKNAGVRSLQQIPVHRI